MMLLDNDKQAQILKLDPLREKRMRSNYERDIAIRETCACFLCFLGVDKSRELADLDRKSCKSIGKGTKVLTREKCRRHNDGNLGARHRGDKGGAKSNLRFSETHIAADEAIH